MSVTWNPRLLSNMLTTTFAPKMAQISSKSAPEATIDVLITFDAQGVSGHPNHKSLYHGAHSFLKALMYRHTGWECPIKLYTLTSTNVVRKYTSAFDGLATLVTQMVQKKERSAYPTPMLLVSGPSGYRAAQSAMTNAHVSQMKWFRWGWIGVSRYMIINDLKKEKIK